MFTIKAINIYHIPHRNTNSDKRKPLSNKSYRPNIHYILELGLKDEQDIIPIFKEFKMSKTTLKFPSFELISLLKDCLLW